MSGVLVYGFGPYMSFADNVTEKTIRALPRRVRAHLMVFDVKFDRDMFERALERLRPDIIIGMGQHPRARKLRLERIARRGGIRRTMSLRLPRTAQTTVTYDAGDYVCNFSMWVVQAWCERHGARCAFIHVPMDYPPARLAAYLETCLSGLRTGAAGRSFPRGRGRSRRGRSALR